MPFVLRDGARSVLADLPKPASSDDAAAAKNARAAWKAIKDGAPLSAGRELLRLELAMSNERTWRAEAFLFFLVEHPFLNVRRLVWGVFDAACELVTTFRVTDHRALVDVRDEAVALPNDAAIAIVHPVRLESSVLDAWRGVFHPQSLTGAGIPAAALSDVLLDIETLKSLPPNST